MRNIRILAFISILLTLAAPMTAIDQVLERTQTVYTIMDWSGNAQETSVVNWIRARSFAGGTIKDKPDLNDTTILQSQINPKEKDGMLIWDIKGDQDIYYTGKTTKQLPLSFKISLKLNGKTVKPEEIKGSGELDVTLEITNNLSKPETIEWTEGDTKKSLKKDVYYPMTVMAQLSMDTKDFKEIKGDETMHLTVGSNSNYTWSVFPKPTAKINFTIFSDNIKLPTMQMSIIPKTPNIDIPSVDKSSIDVLGSFGADPELLDMLDTSFDFDLTSASTNIDQLTMLLDGIKTAVDTANTGLGGLSILLSNYASNFTTMQDGIDGLKQLSEGHKQVIDIMKTQLDANTGGIGEIVSSLQTSSDLSSKVSRDVFKIKASLEDMETQIKAIKNMTSDKNIIDAADQLDTTRKSSLAKLDPIKTSADTTTSTLKTLLDGGTINGKQVPSVTSLPEQMKLLGETLTALSAGGKVQGMDLPGINTTIDGLKGLNEGLSLIIKGGQVQGQTVPAFADIPKQLGQAIDGLKMLVDGGKYNGMTVPPQSEMKEMIADFKKQLESLPDTEKLSKTMEQLKKAIDKAGGTQKVQQALDSTKKLVYQDQAEFELMKTLGKSYTSFVGNTDNAASSVIFVIKLAGLSSDIHNANDVKQYDSNKGLMDSGFTKYRYIILIVALTIIIAAFPINWLYKKRLQKR